MNPSNGPFGGLPYFSDRLHAGFEASDAVRDEAAHARGEEEAIAVLHTLLAIEEPTVQRKDEEGENSTEFLRLERKLDLVIELLSARVMADARLPELNLQFSAEGARWEASSKPSPSPGTMGMFSIYLHRVLPRALHLPAEVLSDESGWCRVRFVGLGQAVEDLLVRYVFLQHRRKLAGARRPRKV